METDSQKHYIISHQLSEDAETESTDYFVLPKVIHTDISLHLVKIKYLIKYNNINGNIIDCSNHVI